MSKFDVIGRLVKEGWDPSVATEKFKEYLDQYYSCSIQDNLQSYLGLTPEEYFDYNHNPQLITDIYALRLVNSYKSVSDETTYNKLICVLSLLMDIPEDELNEYQVNEIRKLGELLEVYEAKNYMKE